MKDLLSGFGKKKSPDRFDDEFQNDVLAPIRKIDLSDEALGEEGNFPLQILMNRTEAVFFSLQYYPKELKNGYLYCGVIDLSYPKENQLYNELLAAETDDDFRYGEAHEVVPEVDYALQIVDEKPPGRYRPLFVHIDTLLEREALLGDQTKKQNLKSADKERKKALGKKEKPMTVRRAVAATVLNVIEWEERGEEAA